MKLLGRHVRLWVLQESNFLLRSNGRTIDRPYKISYRRMNVEDLQEVDDLPWYFCGSPGLKKYVSGFTNKEIVSEDFSYETHVNTVIQNLFIVTIHVRYE